LEIADSRFKMGERKAIGESRFKIQDGELADVGGEPTLQMKIGTA
jgi:hypothetical protein